MSVLEWTLYMEPGQLCHTLLPSLQLVIESLNFNMTSLSDAIFLAVIGDPNTYKIKSDWYSTFLSALCSYRGILCPLRWMDFCSYSILLTLTIYPAGFLVNEDKLRSLYFSVFLLFIYVHM